MGRENVKKKEKAKKNIFYNELDFGGLRNSLLSEDFM